MGSLIQGGVDLPIQAHYTASGLGATGLTVTVDVHRLRSGSWSEVVTAGSATEVGDGVYSYTIGAASVAAGDVFAYAFKTAGTADQKELAGESRIESNYTTTVAGYLDAAISGVAASVWSVGTRTLTSFGTLADDVWSSATRTLTSFGTLTTDTATAVWASGTRTLSSFGTLAADVWAVSTRTLTSFGTLVTSITAALRGGTVILPPAIAETNKVIIQGDDYDADDERALDWDASTLRDLTGATGVCKVKQSDNTWDTVGTVSIYDPGGSGQAIRLELASAETATLDIGARPVEIAVTLSGRVMTLVIATLTVRSDA